MASKDSTRSARLTKYRESLQKEGFSRFELFISQEVRDIVQSIAKEQNIGASQAASLLLEYSAKQYASQRSLPDTDAGSENLPQALQFCIEPWALAGATPSFGGVSAQSAISPCGFAPGAGSSLYENTINPATLGLVRSSREQQLGKSLELPKANAVALGYLPSESNLAESKPLPANPLEAFFKQRKKD